MLIPKPDFSAATETHIKGVTSNNGKEPVCKAIGNYCSYIISFIDDMRFLRLYLFIFPLSLPKKQESI